MSVFRQVWFLKLFGGTPLKLTVTELGVVLRNKQQPERLIRWHDISSPPVISKGVLFSKLQFAVGSHQETINWLSKAGGRKLRDEVDPISWTT